MQQQAHPYQQQPNNLLPPFSPQHQQHQQYPGQQQQQLSHQEPLSPTGDSQKAAKATVKRKSKTDAPAPSTVGVDTTAGSNSSPSSSPSLSHGVANEDHSPTYTATANGSPGQGLKLESDVENGPSAHLAKKAARRKGSAGRTTSMDANSSGLVVKPPHRTNRDGFDPLQSANAARRKTKGDSKNGSVNGITIATDLQEKSEDLKREGASPSPSIQKQSETARSPTPTQTPTQPRSGKKPHHELLTEAEKKANHIASEQKRRQNIRVGFDSLVEIVPSLSDCHRSEAVILQKSVEYIQRLLSQKKELKSRVRELQAHLGDPLDDTDSASDMDVEHGE
ncbi:MAG: hypothetical protein J3Q66DRAFT_325562 [Benniella sp.]|nr:MAG: hypothetical protein J3Q66DRAFT_325562 [Benniella sp.]